MFSTLRHLLPDGRAWRITVDKILRRFMIGIGNALQAFRANFDDVADDMWPASTRLLDEFEEQFGLYPSAISTAERRQRIEAAWSARGGQSPAYIQASLRAAGFDVYVHEWWASSGGGLGSELGSSELGSSELGSGFGATNVHNPFEVLGDSSTSSAINIVSDGENAITGTPPAVTGARGGPSGYLLVNLPTNTDYLIPTDESLWRSIIYIGGETWGAKATIPTARREEFETLCLKICPLQLWIGVLVDYS